MSLVLVIVAVADVNEKGIYPQRSHRGFRYAHLRLVVARRQIRCLKVDRFLQVEERVL